MFRKITLIVLVCILTAFVLIGCQTQPQEPDVPTYKVTFVMKGHIVSEQMVEQGKCSEAVTPDIAGLRFVSWIDPQGNAVDPTQIPVTQATRYEAVAYPDLSKHAPFLFADESGFIWPDEALTADDLYNALYALAVPGAESYFPGLYTGKAKVKAAELQEALAYFFPQEDVKQAFPEDPTKAAFAKGMLTLLDRSYEEKQTTEENTVYPGDIHSGREDAAILLESCIPHTPGENGTTWADVSLPTPYEPGFVNIDGWLYYVQDNGYFLTDDKLGDLYFGADGRYTSGDAELDQYVADILKRFQEENPDKTRFELLRVAYDHCVLDYKYLRKEAYLKGATGWEIEDAKEMFSTNYGNCYNFAAIFWALARGLGYEAYCISGNCTGSVQPHGWVQISFDGEPYFFDPEWHYAYINENRPVKDMFMISMKDAWYWSYDYYPI